MYMLKALELTGYLHPLEVLAKGQVVKKLH